ncbi:hypothetical protein SHIRM173S_06819 [Streptomyces hirsutus]
MGLHVDGREAVVRRVVVHGRGTAAEGGLPAGLSGGEGGFGLLVLRRALTTGRLGVLVVVLVVLVVFVLVFVVLTGRGRLRGGRRRGGRGGGGRRAGLDPVGDRAADPLQVFAGRDQVPVLIDDLHGPGLAAQPRQLVVRGPRGEFGGDRPRRALRLGTRLGGQVGAQRLQDRGTRDEEGHRDHERGAERRPGTNRAEQAVHGAVSSRYPAPRTVRISPARSLRRRALT